MILPNHNSALFRLLVIVAALVVIAGLIVLFLHRPRVSQQAIRERVVTTIQKESRESFLVTGSLDLTVTLTRQNTKVLLPGLLDLSLGEARTTLQVPGRVYYGFDIRKINEADIRLRGDTVFMRVPPPSLLSVDVNLSDLRVQTSKGWLRTNASVTRTEREAVRNLNTAFARQAANHVSNSAQPQVNSAHALANMLRPALVAAGLRNPYFKFDLGQQLLLEAPR